MSHLTYFAWVYRLILSYRKANRALLEGVQDFTVMLKNSVEFPECGNTEDYRRRNILENATKGYLSSCLYNIDTDKLCPIFRIGDVIKWAKSNFSQVALTVSNRNSY